MCALVASPAQGDEVGCGLAAAVGGVAEVMHFEAVRRPAPAAPVAVSVQDDAANTVPGGAVGAVHGRHAPTVSCPAFRGGHGIV